MFSYKLSAPHSGYAKCFDKKFSFFYNKDIFYLKYQKG